MLKKIAGYADVVFNEILKKYLIGLFTAYGWKGFLLRIVVALAFYTFLDDSMGAAKGYAVVGFLVVYSLAKLIFDYKGMK
ncbi:hypothetical protein [Methylobacillus flagellatus]|uniref:hypothetical protein n=1 Tax=Methylobacillus flagellatus TaxID=405 RepID=UPI0010F77C32|nr:hypothetical protein [Methylobacillus flagellatus]